MESMSGRCLISAVGAWSERRALPCPLGRACRARPNRTRPRGPCRAMPNRTQFGRTAPALPGLAAPARSRHAAPRRAMPATPDHRPAWPLQPGKAVVFCPVSMPDDEKLTPADPRDVETGAGACLDQRFGRWRGRSRPKPCPKSWPRDFVAQLKASGFVVMRRPIEGGHSQRNALASWPQKSSTICGDWRPAQLGPISPT